MTVTVGSTVKCTAKMQIGGAIDLQNVFYAKLASGSAVDDDDARADLAEWIDDMFTPLAPYMAAVVTFDEIDFFNVSQDYPMGPEVWPTLTVGTSAGTLGVSGVAVVLTAYTEYVRTNGRKFFGGMAEGAFTGNVVAGAILTAAATTAALWLAPFVGATSGQTWTPGIWSTVASAFRAFRAIVIRDIPGYQRRRKPGVGE
jgi:hypothetical protein